MFETYDTADALVAGDQSLEFVGPCPELVGPLPIWQLDDISYVKFRQNEFSRLTSVSRQAFPGALLQHLGVPVFTRKKDLVDKTKAARRFKVKSSATDDAIKLILQGLESPRAEEVWNLYSSGRHDELTQLEFDAGDYPDVGAARRAYIATELLSKAEFLSTTFNRSDVALTKFKNSEERCKSINCDFTDLGRCAGFTGANVWLLDAVTRKIARVLGSFDMEELLESCSWGPGATASLRGDLTGPVNKFRNESGMTSSCYTLFNSVFSRAYPLWDRYLAESKPKGDGSEGNCLPFSIEKGNRVITVPKNSKTDRVIAAEPGINLWFQLGIGRMIGRRLYRHLGIDLEHQDRNQLLAYYAARSGKLATVDFSAASDTIAKQLVIHLLDSGCIPGRQATWLDVMLATRSVYGELPDGTSCLYEKFSSMGNGYTFPLQSLIFATAAISCCEYVSQETGVRVEDEYVGVFGDDVVIPIEAYQLFSEFCSFLGFSFNSKKSFAVGKFRESCGAHYLGGVDLKPLYIKKRLTDVHSVFRLANGIRRLASRNMYYGCDAGFLPAWRYTVRLVPSELRFRIPEGYGDGGFVSNFDEAAPYTVRNRYWVEGFLTLFASLRPVKVPADDEALALARLHKSRTAFSGASSHHGSEDDIAIGNSDSRRRATQLRVSELCVRRWNDVGPWL